MNVSDLLSLPSFAGATLVAGEKGLYREVSSAMILEAADIEKWGKKGQVILTGFFALKNLSDEELISFFDVIESIGISSIVFKPERLYKIAPENITALCEERSIPLIQIAKDVIYEEIIIDILSPILEDQMNVLNHFYNMHNKMMEIALTQPSIHQILQTLKSLIHLDVTYFDKHRSTLISTKNKLVTLGDYQIEEIEKIEYAHHIYSKIIIDSKEEIIAIKIPSNDISDHYLLIHGALDLHNRTNIMDIENVISLLQMEILKQDAINQKLFLQNNNDVQQLLTGTIHRKERIINILSNLSLDRHPLYQILRITLIPKNEDERNIDEMKLVLAKAVKTNYKHAAYFESAHHISFIRNLADDEKTWKADAVKQIIDQHKKNHNLPEFDYFASLSRTLKQDDIPKGYREVVDICRLFEGSNRRNECISYNDIGVYKIFLDADVKEGLDSLLDDRLVKLRDEAPHLFQMLVILCEQNINYQETASKLFIHPKTIHYRISKILNTYNIDVHNPDDFMQVLLAGKILHLTNMHP